MMEHNPLLDSYLRQLRLPTFAKLYPQFAADAARNNHDTVRFLLALAEQEVNQRQLNMLQQRLKNAHFPVIKELADFDFSCLPMLNKAQILDLARGEYIQQKQGLILIGNPGLGKTHLALGLASAACREDRRVRFWTAAGLVNELIQAQDEHRLHRFIASALKLDLVVLDELGFIPFSQNGAQALFTFCSELYERLALIITTNLKFADWVQVFGDERLTAALLDRLTHHAHIIELLGESYRFRQRAQQGEHAE
ncbi:MAG: IS21-like element helper ATPase IstB [Anaerolineales bacterium]|nr:IS21-like element helper ATPase IstB [Anaerolineales bacterium]